MLGGCLRGGVVGVWCIGLCGAPEFGFAWVYFLVCFVGEGGPGMFQDGWYVLWACCYVEVV